MMETFWQQKYSLSSPVFTLDSYNDNDNYALDLYRLRCLTTVSEIVTH